MVKTLFIIYDPILKIGLNLILFMKITQFDEIHVLCCMSKNMNILESYCMIGIEFFTLVYKSSIV